MITVLKPTRLWHLSGRKHIQNWIKDRLTAQAHDHNQRSGKDMLQLLGIVMTTALGFAYSYGVFSSDKYVPTIIKPSSPNDCMKKCGPDPPPPCDPDKKKNADKPCPRR